MMDDQNIPMYWVPHKDHCWLPAAKKMTMGDSVTFDSEGFRPISIPAKEAESLDVVEADQLLGVEDIATLRFVNEAALLHTIRVRFLKNLIYTRVGRTVIATNPFASLPIYDSHMVDRYAVAADSAELPAHIYCIGKDALEGLRVHKRNQAILISGESGAGKTETAKLIMAFVADAVRCGGWDQDDVADVPIEDKIVQTNPVLEAFGNAMTVRNHNSSRFGHWLDLRFSEDLALIGCSLAGYLLETMRVCSQAKSERSFHIFYQLIGARAQFPDLHLLDAKQYSYLKGGQVKAPGIDDSLCFSQLCEALAVLGFTDNQEEIFRIIAGVLMLGNIDIEDSGDAAHSCRIGNESSLQKAADMLGTDMETLRKCIVVKKISSQMESFETPLRVDQGRAARDTLARLIYNRLFFHLVACMNKNLYSKEEGSQPLGDLCEDTSRLLGILDIAGFESFEQNSLEQLLINLSNELLHQHFNEVIFSIEAEEAEKEGVEALTAVKFTDNVEILEFIDSRNGALDLLDETMALPGGTDAAYVTKVVKRHEKDKCLLTAKFDPMTFGIRHFAGEVFYNCEGWLEKNAENPPTGATELLTSSTLDMLQQFGGQMTAEANAEDSIANRGARKKVKSVSSAFRTSLKALMTKIRKTDPHYVLCMKPNMEQVPKKFNGNSVMHQLLLTGVLGAVQMRQKGYAHRIPYEDFVIDYLCIVDAAAASRDMTKPTRQDAEKLVDALPKVLHNLGHACVERSDFALGSTKVFFKEKAYKPLQEGRRHRLYKNVVKIQRWFRGIAAKILVAEWKDIRNEIRTCLAPLSLGNIGGLGKDGWPSGESVLSRLQNQVNGSAFDTPEEKGADMLDSLEEILYNAQSVGFRDPNVLQAEIVFKRLQLELEVVEEVDDAALSVIPVDIEMTIARATKMKLPLKEKLQKLEVRLQRLHTQMPLKKALERCSILIAKGRSKMKEEELEEVQNTLLAVEEAGLNAEEGSPNDAWVPELDAAKLLRSLRGIVNPIRRMKTQQLSTHSDDDGDDEKRSRAGTAPASPGYPKGKVKGEIKCKNANIALSFEEQMELRRQLKKAADAYDIETLEQLIAKAVESGMDQDEDASGFDSDSGSSFASSSDSGDDKPETEFTLKLARKALRRMHDHKFLRRELRRATTKVSEQEMVPVTSLKKLEQLARKLGHLPGYEEDVQAANGFLQQTMLRISQKSKRISIFDTEDPEELDLASKIFGNLSGFSRLKPSKPWISRLRHGTAPQSLGSNQQSVMQHIATMPGPYRQSVLGSLGNRQSVSLQHTTSMPGAYRKNVLRQSVSRQQGQRQSIVSPLRRHNPWRESTFAGKNPRRCSSRTNGTTESLEHEHTSDSMMTHSKVIIESLTWHTDAFDEVDYDAAATQNFRNVLCAMGDRPAQDCQRIGSRLAIVELAQSDPRLHDEIYMQILKQLINNPVPRSLGLGWELLYNLVKEVKPSDELIEFVRVFITKGLSQMEFSGVSYYYALRISRLLGCRGEFGEQSMGKTLSTRSTNTVSEAARWR